MKRLFTILSRVLTWLFLPVIVYLLIALVFSLISTQPPPVACPAEQTIFIASNGVHLDIILTREQLGDDLREALAPPGDYIGFGWGDKDFYLNTPTWAELDWKVAAKALFLKSETAMHVTHYGQARSDWKRLELCPSQLDALRAYILRSFARDDQGAFALLAGAGYTEQDDFYLATGNYSCLHTSNNWVNIALIKAQVKTAVWSPFQFGVLYHLD